LIFSRLQAIDERMSTMLVEIYDALKEAGASEEKARAAATSLAGRDHSFDWLEQRLKDVERRLGLIEERLAAVVEQKLNALLRDIAAYQGRPPPHDVDAGRHDRRRARAPGQSAPRLTRRTSRQRS
jgi:hypothetical protein